MASAPAPLSNYHCRRRDGVVSAYAHTFTRVDTHRHKARHARAPQLQSATATAAALRPQLYGRYTTRRAAHTHTHTPIHISSLVEFRRRRRHIVLSCRRLSSNHPSARRLVYKSYAEVRCDSLVSVISVRGRIFFTSYHLRKGYRSLFTIDGNDNREQ